MKARRADVLVIGGGVVGLSVAYFAALEGARVLVLEKGEAGSGSSSGNEELNRQALGIHLDFASTGGEAYEFNRRELLFLYLNRARWVRARKRARKAEAFDLKTEILSGEEVRKVEPAAWEGAAGGVRYFSDAGLNPLRFIEWLAKCVSDLGAWVMKKNSALEESSPKGMFLHCGVKLK